MKARRITIPSRVQTYTFGCEYRFACNLKRLRLSLYPRMTQARLARALGVTRNTYAGYEAGTRLPPAWFVSCVAEYFGVTADELLERERN